MNAIFAIDAWWIARMEAALCWLNEWLSITLRRVALILAGVVFGCGTFWEIRMHCRWALVIDAVFPLLLAWYSFEPEKERVARWRGKFFSWWRGTEGVLLPLDVALIWVPPHMQYYWIVPIGTCACFLLITVLACRETGERGRRRKAALAKIKEMFGAGWIVPPETEPV